MARLPKSATPRARKKGDDSTNARKRYYRASERYLKKAESTSGATSQKYRALARDSFDKALSTYEATNTQRFSAPMRRLASEFGVDLEKIRERPTGEGELDRWIDRRSAQQQRAIRESGDVLESALSDPEKRA